MISNICVNNITCTVSGVCAFNKTGDPCNTIFDCGLGAYCNLTIPIPPNGTSLGNCAAQLAKGSNCTDDWMCPQSQGCLNGKCTDYFSKLLGADVSKIANASSSQFCSSRLASNAGICTALQYNQQASNMTTVNKDGLVTCGIDDNSWCNYTDYSTKVSSIQNCQCSYDNQGGRSYCPKAYTENDTKWDLLASAERAFIGNSKCHSRNRFGCSLDQPKDALTNQYDASVATVDAAKLFYADDCIKKLFNAGEFLRLSFVILAALLISLI